MGFWNAGSFGNDDALDWVGRLCDSHGSAVISDSLTRIAEAPEATYLQAPDCSEAIAAAEIVAAAFGKPGEDVPDQAAMWVREHVATIQPELAALARRAVERVANDLRSELRGLWTESGESQAWLSAVAALERRLGGM